MSLLTPIQTWLESRNAKLFDNKKSAKIERKLSERRLSQIPKKYLWAEIVYEVGDFSNRLFFLDLFVFAQRRLACENSRFSSLFAAEDVSRGIASETLPASQTL